MDFIVILCLIFRSMNRNLKKFSEFSNKNQILSYELRTCQLKFRRNHLLSMPTFYYSDFFDVHSDEFAFEGRKSEKCAFLRNIGTRITSFIDL